MTDPFRAAVIVVVLILTLGWVFVARRLLRKRGSASTELVRLLNAWAINDIDLTAAALTRCTLPSLPDDPKDAIPLIHDIHRSFLERTSHSDFRNLRFTNPVRRNVQRFDPTEDTLDTDNPAYVPAKSAATHYFADRTVDVIKASGTDTAHDIIYTLVIALDPKASLLFSFIWNVRD